MPKPICIVRIPPDIGGASGKQMNWDDCHKITETQTETKPDYHWFFLLDHLAEKIEFEVLYEKDFTEVQYEELKKIITDLLPKT